MVTRMITALSATEHFVGRASTKAREQGSGEDREEISEKSVLGEQTGTRRKERDEGRHGNTKVRALQAAGWGRTLPKPGVPGL